MQTGKNNINKQTVNPTQKKPVVDNNYNIVSDHTNYSATH